MIQPDEKHLAGNCQLQQRYLEDLSLLETRPGLGIKTYYVVLFDFENYFAVNVLESTVRHAKRRVVFNEMLPHRDDLWLKVGDQSYVTEFVLEFNRIRDEHND